MGKSGHAGFLPLAQHGGMRWLYSLFTWLLQPLLYLKLKWRARLEPGYAEAIAERFGHYRAHTDKHTVTPENDRLLVWVHAVSLGETRAVAPLLTQLRQTLPGMRLLLTHGTATGRAQGRLLLQTGDIQVWQPWDTPAAVQRFLTHFRPHIGLLVETEIWPNMVAACAKAHIPLCLVNARMSEGSMRRAQRLGWLAYPAYQALHAVWAQTHADAQRLQRLGAKVQGVWGNIKFDATPDATQLAQGRVWRQALTKPVLLFASSREGEEALLLEKLRSFRAVAPMDRAGTYINNIAINTQWLIVPRHPQRFDAVAELCTAAGFSVSRRSSWTDTPMAADIWIGDSLGEMALYFGLADLALLGGSFAPLGGQNLIEAAACDCPVLMGPHTFNFAQAAELALAAGAAFVRDDLAQAVDLGLTLLQSPQELQSARAAARQLSQTHRGATQRTAAAVAEVLRQRFAN